MYGCKAPNGKSLKLIPPRVVLRTSLSLPLRGGEICYIERLHELFCKAQYIYSSRPESSCGLHSGLQIGRTTYFPLYCSCLFNLISSLLQDKLTQLTLPYQKLKHYILRVKDIYRNRPAEIILYPIVEQSGGSLIKPVSLAFALHFGLKLISCSKRPLIRAATLTPYSGGDNVSI